MGSDDEHHYHDHRRKSRKHDDSGRDKHRSSRDGDRLRRDDRHGDRHRDGGRHRERDGGSRDPKSSRGKDGGGRSRDSKLTEEEEKLYAKAREYIKREGKDGRRHEKHDRRNGKDGKRRRSESYDSSDGRDGKRHLSHRKDHKRTKKDDGRGKSSRHKKKSKHDHHRDEEKPRNKKKNGAKSEKSFKYKASPVDSSKLASLGNVVGKPPAEKLDPETDYFSRNSHLRLFLYREFGIYFEDLTSSESHDAFEQFTISYNEGKLERAYYDPSGILPQEALEQCSRTKHQWKFRTNRVEEQSLELVRAGVKKQTEYSEKSATTNAAAAAVGKSVAYPITRMQKDQDGDDAQPRRRTPQEMAAQRWSDKQHRDRIKLANEEMYGAGKADPGWERKRDKRREESDRVHGAARDRDAYGGAELDDDALYGTSSGGRGEGSYEEAVAKQRRYRERKEAEKAARAEELLKQEEDKKRKMLEMLGLSNIKAGQKIEIAPRNDAA